VEDVQVEVGAGPGALIALDRVVVGEPAKLDVDGDGQPDGYFDVPFDCFWFNRDPDWAVEEDASDDPLLSRDDTDGAGPETFDLQRPEDLEYRIGVHYWNDHGWGPSDASLRVWIRGEPVFAVEGVELVNHDLWDAATVAWPSGNVRPIRGPGGGHLIIPDYEHPLFLGE